MEQPTTPFIIQTVMDLLKKNEDLSSLRQLSTAYYQTYTKTYFDKIGKTIIISQRPQSNCGCSSEPREFLSKVSTEFPYIYRHIEIKFDVGLFNRQRASLDRTHPLLDFMDSNSTEQVVDLLRIIGPHIQSIKIDLTRDLVGRDYPGFLNPLLELLLQEFTNLELLVLRHDLLSHIIGCSDTLNLFPQTTQIRIEVESADKSPFELIQAFKAMTSIKNTNVSFHLSGLRLEYYLETDLQRLAQQNALLNWFESSTSRNVKFVGFSMRENDNQENAMRYWDRLLTSWKCTKLRFTQKYNVSSNLSLVPNLGGWKSNISTLELFHFSEPIKFLRDFPNLTFLRLWTIDEDECLFSDPQNSDEQNLREVFEGCQNMEVEIHESYLDRFESFKEYVQQFVRKLSIPDYSNMAY